MLSIYLTGLFLIAVVSLAVATPLFRESGERRAPEGETEADRWRKRKTDALASIRDAELDFHLGKLSESDYRDLRRRLEAEAMEAIHHVDDR